MPQIKGSHKICKKKQALRNRFSRKFRVAPKRKLFAVTSTYKVIPVKCAKLRKVKTLSLLSLWNNITNNHIPMDTCYIRVTITCWKLSFFMTKLKPMMDNVLGPKIQENTQPCSFMWCYVYGMLLQNVSGAMVNTFTTTCITTCKCTRLICASLLSPQLWWVALV